MLAYLLFTHKQETETTEDNYIVDNTQVARQSVGVGSTGKHAGTLR